MQFQYASYLNPQYNITGKGFLKLLLINQRSDFSFGLFSGGLSNGSSSLVLSTIMMTKLLLMFYDSIIVVDH
jgi:hypothetical protein